MVVDLKTTPEGRQQQQHNNNNTARSITIIIAITTPLCPLLPFYLLNPDFLPPVNAPAPEESIELDSEPTTPLIFHTTLSNNIHPCLQLTGAKRLTPFFVVSSPPALNTDTVPVGLGIR